MTSSSLRAWSYQFPLSLSMKTPAPWLLRPKPTMLHSLQSISKHCYLNHILAQCLSKWKPSATTRLQFTQRSWIPYILNIHSLDENITTYDNRFSDKLMYVLLFIREMILHYISIIRLEGRLKFIAQCKLSPENKIHSREKFNAFQQCPWTLT